MPKKPVRYPWGKWLAGRRTPLVLHRGRDYRVLTHSFAQQCRNAAAKLGKRVSINIAVDGKSLCVEVADAPATR